MPWQNQLKQSICTIEQLKPYTDIPLREERQWQHIIEKHPMRVTPYYHSLIDWDDPDDPIARMAIPHIDELAVEHSTLPDEADALADRLSSAFPGKQIYRSTVSPVLGVYAGPNAIAVTVLESEGHG